MSAKRLLIAVAGLGIAVFAIALATMYRQVDEENAAAEVSVAKAASVRHLLRPADFPAGAIAADFGVAALPVAVLQVDGRLRVADHLQEATPQVHEIEVQGAQPQSFALDESGEILAVTNGYFGSLDEQGRIGEAVPLPNFGMRVAPSSHAGAVYLFGGAGTNWRLYRFLATGDLQVVMQIDVPIVAVADVGKDIYAATARDILRIRPGTPEVLFSAPEDRRIQSLAVGADGQLFFSSADKVYALLGANAISIVNDAGGSLRTRDEALYVLDPQRRLLFSLRPASRQLFKEILQ